tara:strand:- start:116563 stop:117267 length:705 start_codon:yes stop_codon:yes gene_type:complete
MSEASAYDQTRRDGMDQLVHEYLPLVKKLALYWSARLPPSIEIDDLMQVGLMGLIQASENYDASQGASFATYAAIRVKGAMLDEVRRNDWVPRTLQQKMRLVTDAIRQVEARNGTVAADREIADELGISLEEYQKMSGEITSCRMTTLGDSDADVMDAENNPAASFENAGFKRALVEQIQSLPEKEQLMMSLYYSEELNLKEIGAIMGVSESRVSQIHGQALARLKSRLGDWTG